MDLDTFRQLHRQATRLARNASDADDLLQDTLLAALQAGRADMPWLVGVLRQQAALTARTAVRRRRREASAMDAGEDEIGAPDANGASRSSPRVLLERLPPAARRVAVLALHGLNADEIRWILALTPAAFRQRLTSIRKVLGSLPPAQRSEALALAYVRDPARSADLQFGLVRRALKAALGTRPGLATHDVDGHLLVIRSDAHTRAPCGNR